jgi:sirohydrochlorin ferrochelatase
MIDTPVKNLSVVLVAHGGGDGSSVNREVDARATRVATRLGGAEVRSAFLKGSPSLEVALNAARHSKRLIIPLFMAEGFFVQRVWALAHAWRSAQPTRGDTWIEGPIGSHPAVLEALAQRIRDIVGVHHPASAHDDAQVVLLVTGHGTAQHPGSGGTAEAAALLLGRRLGLQTRLAFLDQDPCVEDVVSAVPAGARLIVIPFLWGGAGHAEFDLPTRVRHGLRRSPSGAAMQVSWLEPVGSLPVVDDLLVRVVLEAAHTNHWNRPSGQVVSEVREQGEVRR